MSLSERYELLGKLGAGTFGTVHEAFDRHMERRVAIKTVRRPPPGDADAEEAYARVRSEAQAAGRLSQHPNIVVIHDFYEDAEATWIVMELVEGGSLKGLLASRARLTVPDVVGIMDEALSALAHSHDHGVVHRDVKPANLLLTPDRRVKLADFGIARIGDSTRTVLWTVLGAPAYMAPEQLRGEVVDHRADLWSAGVVLFEMLTGEKPFTGSPTSIMHQVLNTEPPAPSRVSGTGLRAFDSVIARALARRPEDRFQTAVAFAEAVRAAARPSQPMSGRSQGRPVAAALAGAGAAGLAAGAVTTFLLLAPSAETRSAELQDAIATAERGLAENRAALEAVERRRAEASQAAAGAERWLQALREQAAAVEREAADRIAARDEASARLGDLAAAASAAEDRLARLRGAVVAAEREVADHRAALQRTQAELAQTSTGREAAQAALRTLEARLVELGRSEPAAEQRRAALLQQASAEEQRRQALQQQNIEAEQALADRRAALDRARQEERILRSQLEEKEQRRRELDRLLSVREGQREQRASAQQPSSPQDRSAGEDPPAAPAAADPAQPGPTSPAVPQGSESNAGGRRPTSRRPPNPPPADPPPTAAPPVETRPWRLIR